MRKVTTDINIAKKRVDMLKGKDLLVRYNKISYFKGRITEAHRNVFVIMVFDEIFDRLSCSYSDLLCGDVAFKEIKS